MNKVFVSIGLSLDGYMAPDGMTMNNPGYKNWGAKGGALMGWLMNQRYFRENLKFGPGGETGPGERPSSSSTTAPSMRWNWLANRPAVAMSESPAERM